MPKTFRCTGIKIGGATDDGSLAFVELIEVSGQHMTVFCPPEGIMEITNRLQAAADLALSRRSSTKFVPGEFQAPLAPGLTDYKCEPSDDAKSLVLSLTTGTAKLFVSVPRGESPKLRAALEDAETAADEKKRRLTH